MNDSQSSEIAAGQPRRGRRDVLAAAARRDAGRLTPEFSESLHRRVMRAVREEEMRPVLPAVIDARRPGWPFVPWAAAAAVILAVGSAWYIRSAVAPPPTQAQILPTPGRPAPAPGTDSSPAVVSVAVSVAMVPSFRTAVERVSAREAELEAGLGSGQLAELSHDARVAARLVLGPLPVKPPKAVDDWVR